MARLKWFGCFLGLLVLSVLFVQGQDTKQKGDVNKDEALTVADIVQTLQMITGGSTVDLDTADFNADGELTVDDVLLLMRRVLRIDDESTISPWLGGQIEAEDGAFVVFPEGGTSGRIEAGFEKTAEASGEQALERTVISADYRLTLDQPERVIANLSIEMPLELSFVPNDYDMAMLEGSLAAEYKTASGEWETLATPVYLDETGVANFDIPRQVINETATGSSIQNRGRIETRETITTLNFRITERWWSSRIMVEKAVAPAKFRFYYYAPGGGTKDSVKSDLDWNSTTGVAVDPVVPDYVEDLSAAFEAVYPKLINDFHNSSGGNVFDEVSGTIHICIEDVGEVDGNTKSGGNIFDGTLSCTIDISNSRLDTWLEMKQAAAHELVHVLQGKYYSLKGITARKVNRWFFEAVATYYSSWANGLTDAQKNVFYGSERIAGYLSSSLSAPDETSFYAVPHFLDWLRAKYGVDLVADALTVGYVSDLASLSSSITSHGGIGMDEFGQCLRDVVTRPQGVAGLNGLIKGKWNNVILKESVPEGKGFFSDDPRFFRTFNKLERRIDPVSGAYLNFQARNQEDALLVIDSTASGSVGWEEWRVFDRIGIQDSDYTGLTPVNGSQKFADGRKTPLTIKDFGKNGASTGVEFLLGNTSIVSNFNVHVAFYILLPPEVKSTSNEKVVWSTSGLGNIPRDYVGGYTVCKNNVPIVTVPLPQDPVPSEMTWQVPGLTSQDKVSVHVIDRHGHAWPELIQARQPVLTGYQVDLKWDSASFHVAVESDAPLTELTYSFNSGATVSVLSGGDPSSRSAAFAFKTEKDFNVDISALPNGSYPLEIRAKDSNGMSSTFQKTVTLAFSNPTIPTLTTNLDLAANKLNVQVGVESVAPLAALTYSFNAGAEVSVLAAGQETRSVVVTNRSFSIDLGGLADGDYLLKVKAKDLRDAVGSRDASITLKRLAGPVFRWVKVNGTDCTNCLVSTSTATVQARLRSDVALAEVTHSFFGTEPSAMSCGALATDPESGNPEATCEAVVNLDGLDCGNFTVNLSATDAEDNSSGTQISIIRDLGDCSREGEAQQMLDGVWWWVWTKTSGDDFHFDDYHEDDVRFDAETSKLTVTDFGSGTPMFMGEYALGSGGTGFVAVQYQNVPGYGNFRKEIRGTFKMPVFGQWGWYWEGSATITETIYSETSSIVRVAEYTVTGSKLGN